MKTYKGLLNRHSLWKLNKIFQKDGVLGAIDKLEKYNGIGRTT